MLTADVLVIGAGPAGSAAAHWLAAQGHDVVVVERRAFPRSKACGDVLTPRAVQQLHDLGLGAAVERWHRTDGVRLVNRGRSRELDWPRHPQLPRWGLVVRRRELDEVLAEHARWAGARLLHGHDAVEPVVERGFVRGAVTRSDAGLDQVVAPYLVVADGANSTFGRALGTFRTRGWPYAAAVRSYWPSRRHDEDRVELHLDLTDRAGNALPGYGWVAPVGDGTVNVGIGLLSTARDFRSTNVAHLLDAFADELTDAWGIRRGGATGVVRVGRVPMGSSVQPTAGPSFVVVGDAAGAASPFTGTGVEAALETGRLAATVVHHALVEAGPTALQRYPGLVAQRFGEQDHSGRLIARLLGRPAAMRQLAAAAVRSDVVARAWLRLATGELRPDHLGLPEVGAGAARALLKVAPDA